MLAATDLGLGSIPTYNSVRFPDILHRILDVPDDERFIEGIYWATRKKRRLILTGPSAVLWVRFCILVIRNK